MPEHIGCCVIVQNTLGEILLAERKGPAYGAGLFGLPGGRVEGDESLESCVRRELAEEVGLIAKQVKYLGVVREWQQNHSFIHFCFVCRTWDGIPVTKEPDKAGEWSWFATHALPVEVLPGHRMGIELLTSHHGYADLC